MCNKMTERLQTAIKGVSDQFDAVQQKRQQLLTAVQQVESEMLRLQGEYRQLNKLLTDTPQDSEEGTPNAEDS